MTTSVALSSGPIHLGLDTSKNSIAVGILRPDEVSPDVEKVVPIRPRVPRPNQPERSEPANLARPHSLQGLRPQASTQRAGRMLVQMLGVFAEFERGMIIDRVINGMERKASNGKWTLGQVPYGFTREPDDTLVPIDDEIQIVQEIFTPLPTRLARSRPHS